MAVYFISCTDVVKVGYTAGNSDVSVKQRRNSMQVGCPYPLIILAWVRSNNPGLESWLHQALNSWRVRGEWFRIQGVWPVIELVRSLPNDTDGEVLKEGSWPECHIPWSDEEKIKFWPSFADFCRDPKPESNLLQPEETQNSPEQESSVDPTGG